MRWTASATSPQSFAEMLLRRDEPGDVDEARAMATVVSDVAVEGFGGLYQRAQFILRNDRVGDDAGPVGGADAHIDPLHVSGRAVA